MRRASPNDMVQNEDEHCPSSRIPIEKQAACLPIIDKTLPLVLNKITFTRKNLLTWVFKLSIIQEQCSVSYCC